MERAMENDAKSAALDLNLSQRLYRALTAGREELFQVLEDPSMEVVRTALKNPVLDDNHLLALLGRRDLSEDILGVICRLEAVVASHSLKVAVAQNPATPGSQLAALLPHLYLFELVTLCSLPGMTPDLKVAAERAIIQRLPTTPLGNKLTLARRGTSAVMDSLMREGDPRFLEACLDNPRLKESAVFSFLSGPNAAPDTISMVARHPRWKNRVSLQCAMLKNPKTPGIWFTIFLPHLSLNDVRTLKASTRLTPAQKRLVIEELKRRGHTIS
jgi:hypothetical protein